MLEFEYRVDPENERLSVRRDTLMTSSRIVQLGLKTAGAVGVLSYSAPSYAYIDVGTGSIILQSIIAGIAVAMGVLRLYWQRLKAFLGGLRRDTTELREQSQDTELPEEP